MLIFGVSHLNLALHLVEHQEVAFGALGVKFPYWRGRRLGIKEIEHALCEFAKFKGLQSSGAGRIRYYRPRPSLDVNKPCQCCEKDSDDGAICDTCNRFWCNVCAPPRSLVAVSFVCPRCTAFETIQFAEED
jgi:hypothetical protein